MSATLEQFIYALQQQGIHLRLDEQQQLTYKAKRGALTPELKARIQQQKAAIIDFLLQAQAVSAAELPQITADPAARYQPFPLTDIQEAYWLGRMESFELHTPSHFYEEFAGHDLDPQRLEQLWWQLVERHEMLRAVVLPSGNQQILADITAYPLPCYDLRTADAASIEAHLDTLRRELFVTRFVPEQWPLFQVRFTQLPNAELRIHFSVDMLIVDWGSYKILLREWAALYYQPQQALPDLNLSFRDYVLAEKQVQATEMYRQAEAYWQQRLPDIAPAPELPLAIDPAVLDTPEFNRRQCALSANEWASLKKAATQHRLTPTGLLLSVFAEVLAQWSKRPRFTINLTLFNRLPLATVEQIHQMVGDFTSLTLLSIDHAALDDSLLVRAQRLQTQLWQDLQHRAFSGVRVLRELNARNHATTQMPVVFTSGLGIADAASEALGHPVQGFSQTPQVWLDCQVEERQGGLWVMWDSVDALFPAGMLDAMFDSFMGLLQGLAADQQLWHTQSLDLLPPAQRQQRIAVNNTQGALPVDLLHTPFVRHAKAQPERIAILSESRHLSYGQLYAEAVQVAQWLDEHGVEVNQLVPVVMEKGWEQVVAVLGVLLAGAAYVPIDADLPPERQMSLLAQSDAKLVLTQAQFATDIVWPNTVQVYPVTPLPDGVSVVWDSELPRQTLTDLAYVIYTSGSTGQPKGVVIDHRGAMNTIEDINQRFRVTDTDRVLALSALNFDLSVYDIFGLLAVGGALVIPNPDGRRDPSHWVNLMTQHGVTLWNTVPALMQMLVEYQSGRVLPVPLRLVMMSGDWIPLDLPQGIRNTFPQAEPISLGGATEASIWSIYYPIQQVAPDWKSIPYGMPLRNQSFQVLNERFEPCPVWVPGQLCIGGIGLAVAYWRDAEKTQQKFFTHPRTGERLYDTGDLGRYLPDGTIEFLGREDFQVKIRGYRIELGEIESHLLKHPQVQKCVVSVVGENRQDQQIVAYVVPDNSEETLHSQTATDQATYAQQAMQGVLTDPMERLQFRLNQPGIRQFPEPGMETHLPTAAVDEARYLRRQSFREYLADAVSLEQLSQLLSGLQAREFADGVLPKYRYGSAGSLYPVQTYVYIKPDRITGLAAGMYYYQPQQHALRLLSETVRMNRHHYDGINQVIYDQAAFAIFLVAEYQAIEPLYGSSARDFCLLEAGYISQLLMMEAADYQLGLCPIGGMNFSPLREAFGLSDSQEMIHSFLGGAISVEQTQHLSQVNPTITPLETQLKSFLEQKLPAYMVPNMYISLDTLPLTANGKIDRNALPAPDFSDKASTSVAPSTELEQQLLDLVKPVLKLERMGITDNFTELGADSLNMVELHNIIRLQLQRDVKFFDIFRHSTVQTLAAHLEQVDRLEPQTPPPTDNNSAPAAPLNPEDIDRLSANLDNLSDAEIEQLLSQLEQV